MCDYGLTCCKSYPGLTVIGLTDGCYKQSISQRKFFHRISREENTIGQTEDGQTGDRKKQSLVKTLSH